MHFAIQLVVMTFYYIPLEHKLVTGILKVTVCSLYIFSILIFRPYKRNVHNFSELLLFLLLIIFSVYPAIYDANYFPDFLLILLVAVMWLILIIIVTPYCLIWMIRKCCHCCKYVKDISMEDCEELITSYRYVHSANDEECFVFPDRLENPKKYNVIVKQGSEIST